MSILQNTISDNSSSAVQLHCELKVGQHTKESITSLKQSLNTAVYSWNTWYEVTLFFSRKQNTIQRECCVHNIDTVNIL